MTLLLQISDPHFGTERAPVVEALVRLAREQRPDVVVLSGDITQRARPAEFAAARRFVDALGVRRVLAIAGNHDIPLFNLAGRLFSPYAGLRRTFGEVLEPVFESADLLVVTVKTTRRLRHKNGQVSAAQIDAVAQRLQAAAPRQVRIVVTHQPVAVTEQTDETNLLRGNEEAVRRWSQAGADIVMGGHIHLPYVLPLHRRQPGLARRVWAVQAGTALSTRVRYEAGNSVNFVRCLDEPGGGRRAVVERWDHLPTQGLFCRVGVDELDCDAG
jgi:3',5'-cyclic AMP phosphodiesterase CpdA